MNITRTLRTAIAATILAVVCTAQDERPQGPPRKGPPQRAEPRVERKDPGDSEQGPAPGRGPKHVPGTDPQPERGNDEFAHKKHAGPDEPRSSDKEELARKHPEDAERHAECERLEARIRELEAQLREVRARLRELEHDRKPKSDGSKEEPDRRRGEERQKDLAPRKEPPQKRDQGQGAPPQRGKR